MEKDYMVAQHFLSLIDDIYGVPFGVGDEEYMMPKSTEDLKETWCCCPECQDLIYFSDWSIDDVGFSHCPICEYEFELY